MPKVSEEHVQSRRLQILAAAYKCFSRQGFRQTTMRDVSREAGLSLGGVYGHFDRKEDLVHALAGMGREQTRAFLDSVPRTGEAPAAVADLLAALVGHLESASCLEAVRLDLRLWGESLDDPELRKLVLRALASARAPFVEEARGGQERGAVDPDVSAEAAARFFLAIFMGLAVQRALDPEADLDACAGVIASLLGGTFDTTGRHRA